MIIVSLCTIPERYEHFIEVLKRILYNQTRPIDQLHVWLNGYAQIPSGLSTDSRLCLHLEPSNPGPWIRYRPAKELADSDIFVTLDDDLIYPVNYIEYGVDALARQPGKSSVCFGGVMWDWIVPLSQLDYHPHKKLIPYSGLLGKDCLIPVLLGGGSFHYAKNLKNVIGMELTGFNTNDDLMASYHLQQQGISILSIAKPENWIEEHPYQSAPHALNRRDVGIRIKTFSRLVQDLGFIPWSVNIDVERAQPACLMVSVGPIIDIEFIQLKTLCPPNEMLHTLEIISGGLGTYTSRPLRDCFEHFVSMLETGGRFDGFLPIHYWRNQRIRNSGIRNLKRYLYWLESLNLQRILFINRVGNADWAKSLIKAWCRRKQISYLQWPTEIYGNNEE